MLLKFLYQSLLKVWKGPDIQRLPNRGHAGTCLKFNTSILLKKVKITNTWKNLIYFWLGILIISMSQVFLLSPLLLSSNASILNGQVSWMQSLKLKDPFLSTSLPFDKLVIQAGQHNGAWVFQVISNFGNAIFTVFSNVYFFLNFRRSE